MKLRCFGIHPADRVFRIPWLPMGFWRFDRHLADFIRLLCFFRFAGGGKVPPGCCPSLLCLPYGYGPFAADPSFSRSRGRVCLPSRGPDEDRSPLLADFPISRFSAARLFLDRLAAGVCFGGGFPWPMPRSPRGRFLPLPSQGSVCSIALPFGGLPSGGGSPEA
jgi:hypothetical protein